MVGTALPSRLPSGRKDRSRLSSSKKGCRVTADELRSFLVCKFAEWHAPDEFIFVPSLPHTSTGKLRKSELRKRFQD